MGPVAEALLRSSRAADEKLTLRRECGHRAGGDSRKGSAQSREACGSRPSPSTESSRVVKIASHRCISLSLFPAGAAIRDTNVEPMNLSRRHFLTASSAPGLLGAAAPASRAFIIPDPRQAARLRLSCREGAARGKTLVEPLNGPERQLLRQVADGAAICTDVNHPGVGLLGDSRHMASEEPCDTAASIAGALAEQWDSVGLP